MAGTKPSSKAGNTKAVSSVIQAKDATEFLSLLKPDRPHVLTFIPPAGGATETVTRDKFDAELVAKRNGTRNCYFVVADLKGPVTKKPSKEQVASVSALWADLDGADKPALLARLSADELDKVGLPPTSAIIDSGGGYHAYWKLSEPFVIDGDPERWAEFERYLTFIRDALDGDPKVVDVSRIMRLPGTINHPGPDKAKKGRTACLSKVIRSSSVSYPIGAFKKGRRRDAMPTQTTATALPAGFKPQRGLDLEALLPGDRLLRVRDILRRGHDEEDALRWRKPDGSLDRSEAIWWVLCECCRAGGVSDETMVLIQLDPDLPLSGHQLEQPKPVEYAQRQCERAKLKAQDFERKPADKNGNPGHILPTFKNVRIALAKLDIQLSFNAFSHRTVAKGIDAWATDAGVAPLDGTVQDETIARMRTMVEERHEHFEPGKEKFLTAVDDAARRNAFHPVRDYLDSVQPTWDGASRTGDWLIRYAGAENTPLNRAVGAIVLMAAVRRVRKPGCKFDEMLVLEGEEGTNKSNLIKKLAVLSEWFTDNLSFKDETDDLIQKTDGRWIIEYGELNDLKKAEIEDVKLMLSRQEDVARLSYGRIPAIRRRQWIAIGTTNESKYLKSTTGNRRFWPVRTGKIDLEALEHDVHQLWAEAAVREAAGESIRLDPSLYEAAKAAQRARMVEAPDDGYIIEHLGTERRGWIAPTDVYRLLGYDKRAPNPIQVQGIARALESIGFESWEARGLIGPKPRKVWWRGPKPQDKALRIPVTLDRDGFRYVVVQASDEDASRQLPLPNGDVSHALN